MNNETFRPNWFVHIAGLGLSSFFAYMAYRSCTDEFVNGGFPMCVSVVSVCAGLAVFVIWLYIRSGLIAYTVTDEGLQIRRLNRLQTISWNDITEIRWNRVLNYFSIWKSEGMISFTSTDGLAGAGDLIYQIHQRSGCKMPDALKAAVYGTSKP
ncbi:MAG: hypothetical protein V4819_06880 [Verrucomicrobiota bacterium]